MCEVLPVEADLPSGTLGRVTLLVMTIVFVVDKGLLLLGFPSRCVIAPKGLVSSLVFITVTFNTYGYPGTVSFRSLNSAQNS